MGAVFGIASCDAMPTFEGSAPLFDLVRPEATSRATGPLHVFRMTVDDDAGRDLRIALRSLVV